MDVSSLDAAVGFFLASCIAPSTSAAYQSAQRRYLAFCAKFGIAQPYPLQENTLCSYVTFLAKESLKHRTIKAYLSGIRCWQIQHSMGNPFVDEAMPRLEYMLLGIKRVEARAAPRTRVRLPITMAKTEGIMAVPPAGA